MIRILEVSLFAIGLLLAEAASCFADTGNLQGNEEDLRKGKIIVSRPESSDDRLLSGRVVGLVEAPIEKVWEAISDYNNMCRFMPNLPVTFLVDKKVMDGLRRQTTWSRRELEAMLEEHKIDTLESDTVYFYNVLAMPFPMADRWYLLRMVRDPDEHTVHWRLVIGNMLVNKGSWDLKTYGGNDQQTLAAYTTYSDSEIIIPKFIINVAFKKTLPDVIKGLRNRVQQLNNK